MKANELMIGDWVISEIEEAGRITELGRDWIVALTYGNNNNAVTDELRHLQPIPLTSEILKKNGFCYDDSPFVQGWCGYGLLIYNGRVTAGQNVSMVCQYVHQLQHILRLCDKNELADNFKI